jgi:hypothetical protein
LAGTVFSQQEVSMRNFMIVLSSLGALAFTPALSLADTKVVIKPEVDKWVMEQPDSAVTIDGDIVVGASVPDKVKLVAVPDNDEYALVVVNKKRALVDRKTNKVVKIY